MRWTALGAIAAVAAIPVAIGLGVWARNDSSSKRNGVPTALVVVEQVPQNAVFAGSVTQIPTPPRYPPEPNGQLANHCGQWAEWLKRQPAAMVTSPTFAVSAPAAAAASITGVRLRVYRADRPRKAVLIRCVEGAGGDEPTFVKLDLARPARRPVLYDYEQRGKIGPIPDAVFTVPPGRTERLATAPRGRPGILYEWSVELDVIVDKRKRTIRLGTKRRPFRTWLGDLPKVSVDYDLETHRWRRVR